MEESEVIHIESIDGYRDGGTVSLKVWEGGYPVIIPSTIITGGTNIQYTENPNLLKGNKEICIDDRIGSKGRGTSTTQGKLTFGYPKDGEEITNLEIIKQVKAALLDYLEAQCLTIDNAIKLIAIGEQRAQEQK